MSVDGDADAAVNARIHSGWFKFRSLASFLTAIGVSLMLQGKSCMLRGSEMWLLKRENELAYS